MRLFDWLLALYPRRFRDRFAAGMHSAFAADYASARARGRLAGLRFLAVTIVHSLWFGIAEWLPRPQTVRSFLSADVRDAVRALKAAPLVTAISVLSLGLGIGANTALFSILTARLRPFAVPEPHALVIGGAPPGPIRSGSRSANGNPSCSRAPPPGRSSGSIWHSRAAPIRSPVHTSAAGSSTRSGSTPSPAGP